MRSRKTDCVNGNVTMKDNFDGLTKAPKKHRRHAGLDTASLYFHILPDSAALTGFHRDRPHRNDGNPTFYDLVNLEGLPHEQRNQI